MKVLVTGASGFLGSHVVQLACEQGHEVRALVRKTSDTRFLRTLSGVTLIEGAVEDREACQRACAEADAVVHCAGLVKARSKAEFHLTNVIGTQNMLDAALEAKTEASRFVFVSSLAARAPSPEGLPLPADAPAQPVTAYGQSKLQAEQLVLRTRDKLHVTVVRPSAVYGPRDREMFQIFQYAERRVLPFIGSPSGKLTMIYGEDCARAILLCLKAPIASGRCFDVDDGKVYSRTDLIAQLEHAVGKPALVRFPIPNAVVRLVGLAGETFGRLTNQPVMVTREKVDELLQQWVGDSSAAQTELGFHAQVDWQEGARRTVDWYHANGWL